MDGLDEQVDMLEEERGHPRSEEEKWEDNDQSLVIILFFKRHNELDASSDNMSGSGSANARNGTVVAMLCDKHQEATNKGEEEDSN